MDEIERKKNHILISVRTIYAKYEYLFTESLEVLEKKALDIFMNKDLSDDQIIEEMMRIVEQRIKNYENKEKNPGLENIPIEEQKHYDLNDLFDCRITKNCLHIHVVPKSVKKDMAQAGGPSRYLKDVVTPKLDDALAKINEILSTSEKEITVIMAVSPTLRLTKNLFSERGFDVSETKEEVFQRMFGNTKIFKAVISREKFMSIQRSTEKSNSKNELDEMFNNKESSEEVSNTSENNFHKRINSNQT